MLSLRDVIVAVRKLFSLMEKAVRPAVAVSALLLAFAGYFGLWAAFGWYSAYLVYKIYLGMVWMLVVLIVVVIVDCACSCRSNFVTEDPDEVLYTIQLDLLRKTFEGSSSSSSSSNTNNVNSTNDPELELNSALTSYDGQEAYKRPCSVQCSKRLRYRCLFGWVLIAAIILMLPVLVYVYKPLLRPLDDVAFSQLGAVTDRSIRIGFRAPQFSTLFVEFRPVGQLDWSPSTASSILAENDFVATVQLDGLQPDQEYEYRAQFTHSSGTVDNNSAIRTFHTAPVTTTSSNFTFSFGSCVLRLYPRLMGGMEGYKRIYNLDPDFFMLIGDQIYIDAPMFLGTATYPAKYRDAISDINYQLLANKIPTYHIYDDHEIINDYDGGPNTTLYQEAINTNWARYSGALNPDPIVAGSYYYQFNRGDVAFFVLDTRAFRSPASMDRLDPNKTLLGRTQLNSLKAWINQVRHSAKFKFIISSVPWTLNTNFQDSAWGYQKEREEILDFISTTNTSGVVFLTGDAHWSGVFRIRPSIFEFSNSPIDAFPTTAAHVSTGPDEIITLQKGHSYVNLLHVDTSATEPFLEYKLYEVGSSSDDSDDKNGPIFTYRLTLADLTPK